MTLYQDRLYVVGVGGHVFCISLRVRCRHHQPCYYSQYYLPPSLFRSSPFLPLPVSFSFAFVPPAATSVRMDHASHLSCVCEHHSTRSLAVCWHCLWTHVPGPGGKQWSPPGWKVSPLQHSFFLQAMESSGTLKLHNHDSYTCSEQPAFSLVPAPIATAPNEEGKEPGALEVVNGRRRRPLPTPKDPCLPG